MNKAIYPHTILPLHAQELLKSAAQVKGIASRDEAIDAATEAIRQQNPALFRPVPIVELTDK